MGNVVLNKTMDVIIDPCPHIVHFCWQNEFPVVCLVQVTQQNANVYFSTVITHSMVLRWTIQVNPSQKVFLESVSACVVCHCISH